MKKLSLPIAVVTALTLGVTLVFAAGLLNLPTDPVTISHGPWLGNAPNSTIVITLSDVPAGYDVMNGPYDGWCIEDNGQANAPVVLGTLYEPDGLLWEQVNWVLNNWQAYTSDYFDAQVAIWLLTGTNNHPVSASAQALYDAALANGAGFMSSPGQVVAVVAFSDTVDGADMYQDTIIEVPYEPPPPPPGGEGCTPGYWKGKQHLDDWGPTGYFPADDFDAVFGVDYFDPDITLLEAAKLGGGGVKKLARHGVAALLSAAHPDVDYPYTVAEVIAFVQAGNAEPLVEANELGCEIP